MGYFTKCSVCRKMLIAEPQPMRSALGINDPSGVNAPVCGPCANPVREMKAQRRAWR